MSWEQGRRHGITQKAPASGEGRKKPGHHTAHVETTEALSPLMGGKEGVLKAMVFYLGSEDENQFTGQWGAGEERSSMSQTGETEPM